MCGRMGGWTDGQTDRQTDGPRDRWMDIPSHRDAWTHLKRRDEKKSIARSYGVGNWRMCLSASLLPIAHGCGRSPNFSLSFFFLSWSICFFTGQISTGNLLFLLVFFYSKRYSYHSTPSKVNCETIASYIYPLLSHELCGSFNDFEVNSFHCHEV